MPKIHDTVHVTIDLSPERLADLVSNMCSDEQSLFLNRLADNVKEWDGGCCMQLEWIRQDKHLSMDARRLMEQIGNYAWNRD